MRSNAVMKWSDLKRLETLIQQAEDLGACVEKIGLSGEGRSLYGVTIGNKSAKHTVLIVAGFHAAEVIAPLTAISILQAFPDRASLPVRLCIVPVADPDFTFQNANALSEIVTLQSLLNLEHQRDLEGHFTTDLYPECVAIRQWIEQLDRVDAYLSLHSAHCISPGLFFYASSTSNLRCISQVANAVTATAPAWIPLLTKDPTGVSQKTLSPGFFEMEIPNFEQFHASDSNHSIAFVAHRFEPQYIGVPEMPLAVCQDLAKASLVEIDRCNREFKQTGQTDYSFQEIDLDTQLNLMTRWIWSVIEAVVMAV